MLAQLIGLPSWLPRVMARVTAVVLVLAFLLSPGTVMRAIEMYGTAQSQRVWDMMQPFVTPDVSP